MSILNIHKLFLSPYEGWDDLAHTQHAVLKLFVFLVLPFSLIPPLMLEYAGNHIGAAVFPDVTGQAWSMAALVFLVAELITVPLMAWAIKSVANSKAIASTYREAFTLAAVAAVPLWLSSLVLFSDQIALIVSIVVLGLAASVVLVFRGAESVLKVDEGLVAFDIAYVVTALGLIAWALLIMLGLAPALA